jgi:uncharacterized protein (DUF1499 family)
MKKSYLNKHTGLIIACTLLLSACSGTPVKQGVTNFELAPCSSKPNCVSSQDEREDFFIAPVGELNSKAELFTKLQTHITQQSNVEIKLATNDYIWAVYTTSFMRFDDDVEFYLSPKGDIQIRSASRVGYSDLGKNRKRIEALRKSLTSKASK